MAEKVDLIFYPELLGSMTSNDGTLFCIHAKDAEGADRMLAFHHAEIPRLIEMAAVQVSAGAEARGDRDVTAFNARSFSLGVGENGVVVLSLAIGAGAKLTFALPGTMTAQLSESLNIAANNAAQIKGGEPLN